MTDNTLIEALRLAAAELHRQHVLLDEQQLTIAALNSCIGCETTTENLTAVGRLEARIADLEAQLESIGAGGVTGPLIGQPQAMPDLSQLTERGAKAWAGVDAQELREGFTAADMATAAAQGFRDGAASIAANAGEPAAYLIDWPDEPELGHYFSESPTETGRCRPLYLAAPPTAQAGGWRQIPAEPTGAMLAAAEMALYEARSTLGRYAAHKAAYRALLAAAPLPPASAEGVEHG